MVTVSVSETYDLSTKVNRMGIVGIHTPTGPLLMKLWGGLLLQHKKFKFVKCDVAMACASMLPADPLQIGVEAGAIAPQDMFNPILYKAVSNDSMSNFMSLVNSMVGGGAGSASSLQKGSITDIHDTIFGDQGNPSGQFDQFEMYYALLSDSDAWRKAMPQSGLEMRDLYPLVYQMVSNYGGNQPISSTDADWPTDPGILTGLSNTGEIHSSILPHQFRGPSMRMPSIDTTYFTDSSSPVGSFMMSMQILKTSVADGDGSVPVSNIGDNSSIVPPCYVGLIVLPPAKLNQLYYRLKVTWTVELSGLRSLTELSNWGALASAGATSYGTDYESQSSSMSSLTGMVDTNGADIQKIMEGA